MIDVLFVAYNRLEMTRESFTCLAENTDWAQVERLFIRDDGSTDGTSEWLQRHAHDVPRHVDVWFNGDRLGGPVASMNWYLDQQTDADRFAKIDNDFIVPPGWLEEMLLILTARPDISILGMEPWHGGQPGWGRDHARRATDARHIGGKGIIRKRAFELCRPSPSGFNGYGGFSEWQMEHEHVSKAWICPDLCAFGLDQLPFDPWHGLAREYAEKGWGRLWGPYPSDGTMNAYWDWWTPRWL